VCCPGRLGADVVPVSRWGGQHRSFDAGRALQPTTRDGLRARQNPLSPMHIRHGLSAVLRVGFPDELRACFVFRRALSGLAAYFSATCRA
jgi:hypothetical protein